jgi:aminoglycoside/choline kinase family phosphotransferase
MQALKRYIATTPWKEWELTLASADASFRRYFRLSKGEDTLIVMDSSQEKASLKPFIDVTDRLLNVGVNAPKILHVNLNDGFLILQDFGNIHYLNRLNRSNYEALYTAAMREIITMQDADTTDLPLYDATFLHTEMALMQEWYLEKYLHVDLTTAQKQMIKETLNAISHEVLSQPQEVFVHRDYHSRNIMIQEDGTIGIIDYQDAMSGAITYDLVSLLKDCYIAYDPKEIERLALMFRDMKQLHVDDATFIRWFDFMGLQRHIKVLGIFCRLYLRDGKDGYLNDLILTRNYVIETAHKYKLTQNLATLLSTIDLPNI